MYANIVFSVKYQNLLKLHLRFFAHVCAEYAEVGIAFVRDSVPYVIVLLFAWRCLQMVEENIMCCSSVDWNHHPVSTP